MPVEGAYNSYEKISAEDIAEKHEETISNGSCIPDAGKTVKITVSSFQAPVSRRHGETSLFYSGTEYTDEISNENYDYEEFSATDVIEDYEDAVIRVMEEKDRAALEKKDSGYFELNTTGKFEETSKTVSITYDESSLSGMEGAVTSIQFDKTNPEVIAILRSGSVKSAFILEEGKRHVTVYDTQIMPFEICVFTKKAENKISVSKRCGEISLDYIVEVKGMDAQRTKLRIKVE